MTSQEISSELNKIKPHTERPAPTLKVLTVTEYETPWDKIAEAAAAGTLDKLLKSGDYIPLTLTNGDEVGLDVGRDESGEPAVYRRGAAGGADRALLALLRIKKRRRERAISQRRRT